MKEAAVNSRKGVGRTASHRATSSSLRTSRGCNTPKSSLHVCPHCRRAFPFSVALQLHIKDHLVQNTFRCNLCTAAFSSKYQLSVHLRKHAGLDLYKCDQCGVKFINASNLQRHIRNGVCHKRELQERGNEKGDSDSIKVVDVHSVSSDGDMQASCDGGGLETLVRTNLQSCEACNETFTSIEDYSHHKDLHKTGNIFTCRNCSKNFCTLPRLSGETLGEDEKYWRNKCMLCGATCHSDNDLFIHLRRHLDNNEDLYCKQCQSSRCVLDPKGNNIASSAINESMEDITSKQPVETAPALCLSSVTSNCITSSVTATPSTSNNPAGPPLTFSQVTPFQTTAYFTTNLSNVGNFTGALYHQPDFNSGQQRVLQSVCSVVPAIAQCSAGASIDLCPDGTITQTTGVLATTAPGVFMVNPAMRRSNSTQSFPCSAQILSSVPMESAGSAQSCVPTAWPLTASCTSSSNVAVTSCSLPSITVAATPNLVSCLTANTAALLTPSANCYTNQMFPCLPCPDSAPC